jgi:TIR domain
MFKSAKFRGRVFICYRREETAYPAGLLFDRLTERFGSDRVFKDTEAIKGGDNWVVRINQAVGSCDVLLAVIGKEWLTIRGENRKRRLNNPMDPVRVEIEAALTRNIRVIPILVDNATMPHARNLPDSMADFAQHQAIELSAHRLDHGFDQLIEALNTSNTRLQLDKRKSQDWRVELISRSRFEVTFRLYSGSRQHFIKFRRKTGDDVLFVDGKPVIKQSEFFEKEIPVVDEYGRILVGFKLTKGGVLSFVEAALNGGTYGLVKRIGPVQITVNRAVVYEDSGEAIIQFGKAAARRVGRYRR